jgi:hypothetical protein
MRLLASEFLKFAYIKVAERRALRKVYPPSSFMMTEENVPVKLNHQVDDFENYEKLLEKKNIILLVRKSHGWGGRFWHATEVIKFVKELETQFPDHNVVTHTSDSILHPDFCYACEMIELTSADIMIGK